MARSGFQSILSKLGKRIVSKMKLREALTADWMQAVQDAIWGLAEGENIKKGTGIFRRQGPGWTLLSTRPGEDGSTQDSSCQLFPYGTILQPGDQPAIGITWGTIAGRQPTGFSAGGAPPFAIAASGSSGLIYAKATADLISLTWKSSEIVLSANNQALQNTTTDSYTLIGSYTVKDRVCHVEGICGPVTPNICDLATA